MLQRNTLLVIGAGASAEVDFPVGTGLTSDIATALGLEVGWGHDVRSGDRLIYEALITHANKHQKKDIRPYLAAAQRVSRAVPLTPSIDTLLEIHQGDQDVQLCGKLGIVKCILDAESRCNMLADPSGAQFRNGLFKNSSKQSWFPALFHQLSEGLALSDVDRIFDRLSVINFNYDRCLEFFLINSLCAVHGLDLHHARRLVSGLQIIHPYGVVGTLPSQQDVSGVAFGDDEIAPQRLLELAAGIRTFSEQESSIEFREGIYSKIRGAELILFLGFGFLPQNVRLLSLGDNLGGSAYQRVFATGYEVSAEGCVVVRDLINKMLGRQVGNRDILVTQGLSCAALFDRYRYNLARYE